MNHADLKKSPRLQRLLAFLQARGTAGATTMEIIQWARVAAVSAAVAELRENGHPVACKAEGRTEDGGTVYRYHLESAGPTQGDLFGSTNG